MTNIVIKQIKLHPQRISWWHLNCEDTLISDLRVVSHTIGIDIAGILIYARPGLPVTLLAGCQIGCGVEEGKVVD